MADIIVSMDHQGNYKTVTAEIWNDDDPYAPILVEIDACFFGKYVSSRQYVYSDEDLCSYYFEKGWGLVNWPVYDRIYQDGPSK